VYTYIVKKVLRSITFTLIALYFTGELINGFHYSGDELYAFLLIALGFSLVNYFFPILARFLSLPSSGIFSIIISVGINFLMLYLFDKFVPQFAVTSGSTPNLNIFGFMLPSMSLTEMWAMVLSSALLSTIYTGLNWLGKPKKEK
jgi:uncharacterized membrane protein YvlD (DUF360 family)